MHVVHRRRLAAQARRVVIVDVARAPVEQVERIQRQSQVLVELVADAQIAEQRAARLDARVLDQRARAEVARLHRGGPGADVVHGHAQRGYALDRAGNKVTRRVVAAEPRPRCRHIRIEQQPRPRSVAVRPFDAVALARPAGLGRSRVAGENQFRIQREAPQRERALQLWYPLGAHAQLTAARAHQHRRGRGGRQRFRIDAEEGAARVVAVKPRAHAEEIFGLAPRAENQVELGRSDMVAPPARVGGEAAAHVEVVEVGAQAGDAAEFFRPLQRILRIQAGAGLAHRVRARGRKQPARGGALQRNLVDVVAAQLHSDFDDAFHFAEPSGPEPVRRDAHYLAAVRLPELVAVDRVVHEIGEVGKQLQPVFD